MNAHLKPSVLVIGCSLTMHHWGLNKEIPGVCSTVGDTTATLSKIFPQIVWYNFGKGGSSNFEYLRRISSFISSIGQPTFVLIQMTFAERMLIELGDVDKIELVQESPQERENYICVQERAVREKGIYISKYNMYDSILSEKERACLKKITDRALYSKLHSRFFWEQLFLLQSYLSKRQIPSGYFLAHHPLAIPNCDFLPIDWNLVFDNGDLSLTQWIEARLGPYDSLTISESDWHLKSCYNEIVANEYIAPRLKQNPLFSQCFNI